MSQSAFMPVVGEIRWAGQFAPFAAARAAPKAARRRCIACNGVSPGRISEDGLWGPESIGVANFSATEEIAAIEAAGSAVVGRSAHNALCKLASGPWRLSLIRALRRRVGLCPSSRLSHSRKASSEIATPRPRSAVASTSTESPARRSRSNSSRCGSRCAVFRSRSLRACAAKSASVGGELGAISWLDCVGAVVMWERYVERAGSAMGVVWDRSKPRGLDVGVLTYGFLLFYADEFSSWRLLRPVRVMLHLLELWRGSFGGRTRLVALFGKVHFGVSCVVIRWIQSHYFWWVEANFCSLGWVNLVGGGSW